MTRNERYPALLLEGLTPVYDLFARLFIPEKKLKRRLITQARITPGSRVLDLGAGTGTLAIMVKETQPDVQVTGLDGDPDILRIARKKAARAGAGIRFDLGNATALPYPDQTFDRVLSSLVMSVLSSEQKQLAIQEAYRVLKENGEIHIADFGPPHTRWGRWVAPKVRRFEPVSGNLDGVLPVLYREAGFERVTEEERFATIFGTLSILSGTKL